MVSSSYAKLVGRREMGTVLQPGEPVATLLNRSGSCEGRSSLLPPNRGDKPSGDATKARERWAGVQRMFPIWSRDGVGGPVDAQKYDYIQQAVFRH